MGNLPAAIPATLWPDGSFINSAGFYSSFTSLVSAIRNRINVKTSIWQGVLTATTATIADSTWTDVPLDATTVDTDGVGISSNGYKAPVTGYYLLGGRVAITTGYLGARLIAQHAVAGSRGNDGSRSASDLTGAYETHAPVGWNMIKVTRGQVITIQGWQNQAAVQGPNPATFTRSILTVVRYT